MHKPAAAAAGQWREGELTFPRAGLASSAEEGRDGDVTRTPSFESEEEHEPTSSSMAAEDDCGDDVPEEMPGRNVAIPSLAAAVSSMPPMPAHDFYRLPPLRQEVNFQELSNHDGFTDQDPLSDVLCWLGWADVDDEQPPPQERQAYRSSDTDLSTSSSCSSSSSAALPAPSHREQLLPSAPSASNAPAGLSIQEQEAAQRWNELAALLAQQGSQVSVDGSVGSPEDYDAVLESALHSDTKTPDKADEKSSLAFAVQGFESPDFDGLLEREGAEDTAFESTPDESYPDVPSEAAPDESDHLSGVASDEDQRARPSPYVTNQPLLMLPPSMESKLLPFVGDIGAYTSAHAGPRSLHHRSSSRSSAAAQPEPFRPDSEERDEHTRARDVEENEWLARKRLTGAIGRLVRYKDSQDPRGDLLGLWCSRHGRLIVTALCKDGPASRSGVCLGDQLVSVDGIKNFDGLDADTVRGSLKAPTTLVFLGFAGKLQAEVRVRQPDQPRCGLPIAADVATCSGARGDGTNVQLCDTVVFMQPVESSLLLEVPPGAKHPSKLHASAPEVLEEEIIRPEARQNARVYELRRDEAQRMLKRALRPTGRQDLMRHTGVVTDLRLPPCEGIDAPLHRNSREPSPTNSLVGV